VYLLVFVSLLPGVLRHIPTAALGAILVFTGYKLVDLKNVQRLRSYGRYPVAVYLATVVAIVSIDLLTGVLTGIFLSAARLVYKVTHLRIQSFVEGNLVRVDIVGVATFIRLPKLAHALESVPMRSQVHIDVERLAYIDDSCLDFIRSWKEQYESQGGGVTIQWAEVEKRFAPIDTSPVLVRSPLGV
jgi:MFS superfamily sulfate permease-like transporter